MNRKITKNKDLVERNIRGQLILVPLKTAPARLDALYTLNKTAGLLWNEIHVETAEETLVARLLAEYEVDETIARNDVEQILNGLASIGAVTLTP